MRWLELKLIILSLWKSRNWCVLLLIYWLTNIRYLKIVAFIFMIFLPKGIIAVADKAIASLEISDECSRNMFQYGHRNTVSCKTRWRSNVIKRNCLLFLWGIDSKENSTKTLISIFAGSINITCIRIPIKTFTSKNFHYNATRTSPTIHKIVSESLNIQ